MVVSELTLLDFFTQTLHLPEAEARNYVQDFVVAEEKLHSELVQTIDKKFEERKDTLATKQDIHQIDEKITALQLATKQDIHQIDEKITTLQLATKQDIYQLDQKITALQLATKQDIHLLDQKIGTLEVRIEQNTNKLLIWLVSVIFASSGLIVALIKWL